MIFLGLKIEVFLFYLFSSWHVCSDHYSNFLDVTYYIVLFGNVQILLETCLFEHSKLEVSVWLNNMMTLDPRHRPQVVNFLQSCLTKAIRNPHPYNDRVADCVASGQSSRQQGCHRDTATDTKAFNIEGMLLSILCHSPVETCNTYVCIFIPLSWKVYLHFYPPCLKSYSGIANSFSVCFCIYMCMFQFG